MNLRVLLIIPLLVSFSMPVISAADPDGRNNKITPYGDFCPGISHYGMHKSEIDMKHAEDALKHYYGRKGLTIEIFSREDRFIKARVKDNQSVVDIIIFDRSTGRLRSIY